MIIGDCPYSDCDEPHMIGIAPKCPAFSEETCEGCGRKFWLKHSRLDPQAFTPEEFSEQFEIDESTKQVRERTR